MLLICPLWCYLFNNVLLLTCPLRYLFVYSLSIFTSFVTDSGMHHVRHVIATLQMSYDDDDDDGDGGDGGGGGDDDDDDDD